MVGPEFVDKALVGAIAAGSKNGWITTELFRPFPQCSATTASEF